MSRFRVDADATKHQLKMPDGASPLLWSYELIGRAMREMVNLKAFEWFPDKTPIFDVENSIVKGCPNLRVLKPVPESPIELDSVPVDRLYVSLFETPIMYNMVSFTVQSLWDALDSGKAMMNFLTTCRQLEYLNLYISDQALVEDLILCGRWSNLRNLSLRIHQDHDTQPTEEATRDFVVFHSNLVSLTWHISFKNKENPNDYSERIQLIVTSLPSGSLPRLQVLDGNEDFVRTIVTTPCSPSRHLKKITNFPMDTKTWESPIWNLQGLNIYYLKIVTLSINSLSQLATFCLLFPNVECVDFSEGLEKLFPTNWRNSNMLHVEDEDEIDKDEDNAESREEYNHIIFSWIHSRLPKLEFCASDSWGVNFLQTIFPVYWEWASVPMEGFHAERERDFTVPEESDQSVGAFLTNDLVDA
ncbi:hypothetical protein Clacol_005025 [Clathrus columnatus]|uniref:Uncharacterized protein n=1 Tax=Clathrus columnatus TaxID=1419009 RepID=A0AAV5AB44_9AGAM|nr:hypothetical protein Clacol_005025 [Clathrus columnatus]